MLTASATRRGAAQHFAFLILSVPLDRAMFLRFEESFTAADLERFTDAAVRVFLAAYGPSHPAPH